MSATLTIWCNQEFRPEARALLEKSIGGHRLVFSGSATAEVQKAGLPDAVLAEADIALGQPDVSQLMSGGRLKWVELTTAGYTRYDRDDLRERFRAAGAFMTNASSVFADACAQHVLAMMLAGARSLPEQLDDQRGPRSWNYMEGRFKVDVLTGRSVVLLGYGAIGRRLAELLAPFGMKITAMRRAPRGDEAVRVITEAGLPAALAETDHVINLLPENDGTRGFMSAARFGQMKHGSTFYNIGRGATVDQDALLAAFGSGRPASAWLDVTTPEPLPKDHPLWMAKGCHITPHLAGGHRGQDENIVRHFLVNLARFERGEPLVDRIA